MTPEFELPNDGVQVFSLQFTGGHERYDATEAAKAWTDLNRVLVEAGMSTRVERTYTSSNGTEYSYEIRTTSTGGFKRVTYASELRWESVECHQEVGIVHPFSDAASAVLRDNTKEMK